MAYTDRATVKAYLNVATTDATQDAFIDSLIVRVTSLLNSFTDNVFEAVTATRKFDIPHNWRRLLLDEWLLSCTSVTNGNGVVIPTTEYTLEDYNNPPYYAIVLNPVSAYFWYPGTNMNPRRCIAVAGTWGYFATCPADVAGAVVDWIINLYRSRDGIQNTAVKTVITSAGVVQTPMSIPQSVVDAVKPYAKTVLTTQVNRSY
jgi:hypothetical protein